MASSGKRFKNLKSWIAWLIKGLKKAWQSFRRGLKNFINAPLSWTWGTIKSLYGQLTRFIRWLLMLPVRFFKAVIKWFADLTGRRVWAFAWRLVVWVSVLLGIGLFFAVHWPASQVPDVEAPDEVVYLNQGWGPGRGAEDRQTFYFTPQGTGNVLKHMRYDWFVNLELPWGKNRFADPLHMLSYGFQLDAAPTPRNPDHLPVGFTKHFDPRLGEDVLDITCATCHTGNLLVDRPDGTTVSMRIDGGQGMHAFTASNMPHFVPVLIASMTSTLVNPFKFNRFAHRVLGEDNLDGKDALRKEFKRTFQALLKMGFTEISHGLVAVQEGYGRTDALTRIGNAVFGDHITADNYKKVNAPVNYPPVWNIWKFDWVQYSGSVAQPMARNLGESLGVGTTYMLRDTYGRPMPEDERYVTSSRMLDLHSIEEALRKLQPPIWDEDLLGDIDNAKATKGGIAFIRTCQGCHGPHQAGPRQKTIEAPLKTDDDPHWRMKLLPVGDIGTDPVAAVNFVRRTFDLSKTGVTIGEVAEVVVAELSEWNRRTLAYDFPEVNAACAAENREVEAGTCTGWDAARKKYDDEMQTKLNSVNLSEVSNGAGLWIYGLLMKRKMYDEMFKELEDEELIKEKIADLNGFGALDIPQVLMVYKARPLGGMWATAPFLHNGSVRNLYQLLSPFHERDRKFFIGRPRFDPEHVGIMLADRKNGGFWLDTTIDGNANTGHEFRDGYTKWKEGNPPQFGVIGPAYTQDERYEIIEYLKVHLDDPPMSGLFADVFANVVAEVMDTMQGDLATSWPDGEACNLHQYLENHSGAEGLSAELQQNIDSIQQSLVAYFQSTESPETSCKKSYQPDGEYYQYAGGGS